VDDKIESVERKQEVRYMILPTVENHKHATNGQFPNGTIRVNLLHTIAIYIKESICYEVGNLVFLGQNNHYI
jgi:hypothetical protein